MDRNHFFYFFLKVRNRIRAQSKRLWKYCDVNKIAMIGYIQDKSFVVRLSEMLGDIDASVMKDIDKLEKETIIASADNVLRHEFDLLGSGPVKLDPIDWHIDFKSGKRWKCCYYREISSISGADIKVPWELSRCHHLLWLGEAYLLTGEEKFAQEIVNEIEWWIDDNPLMYSVNWKCSMDVAIRAVNWMFAINMISKSEVLTDVFVNKVSSSLYKHGWFIRHNLEKTVPWSNNHYTTDLVGLLYLGTLFKHTRFGKHWQKFSIREFYEETRRQILPSGVHYEKSISYHRLMTELTCYSITMLRRVGVYVPDDIICITQKMYGYVGSYIKPNGKAPLLADNDNGRFLPFSRRDFWDHNYLLNAKGVDFKIINNGVEPYIELKYNNYSQLYEDAGIAIIKEYNAYLLVNNSGYSKFDDPLKKSIGTHTHNDQLSFEFSINNDDIIIDPGAYLYTSSIKDRNIFRSTPKHNTVMVDNEEQNFLSESNAFLMIKNNKNLKLLLKNGECIGSYETLLGGMKHERHFKLAESSLEITDRLNKKGINHQGSLFFHLPETINVHLDKEGTAKMESPNFIVTIRWIASNTTSDNEIKLFEDAYSPSYGCLVSSKCLRTNFIFNYSCTMKTILEWKIKKRLL